MPPPLPPSGFVPFSKNTRVEFAQPKSQLGNIRKLAGAIILNVARDDRGDVWYKVKYMKGNDVVTDVHHWSAFRAGRREDLKIGQNIMVEGGGGGTVVGYRESVVANEPAMYIVRMNDTNRNTLIPPQYISKKKRRSGQRKRSKIIYK